MMANEERCRNFNHGRSNVSIRYCPDCGEKINAAITTRCDEAKHAMRRKERSSYCCDCSKKLR